jgi:hypothetical protein
MHHSLERFANELEEIVTDTWTGGDVTYGEMFSVIRTMFKNHLSFTKDMAPDAPDIVYPPVIYLNNISFYDPINLLFDIVEELYPDTRAFIQFDSSIKGGYGYTCFPEDKSIPVVNILPTLEYGATLEVIAHELAHVVSGENHEHDKKWESVFNNIHKRYNKFMTGEK